MPEDSQFKVKSAERFEAVPSVSGFYFELFFFVGEGQAFSDKPGFELVSKHGA